MQAPTSVYDRAMFIQVGAVLHMDVCVCMYVCMCMHMCVYVCMSVQYVCVCVCMHTSIHMLAPNDNDW